MSGAGKSTLVRCINLLERPTEGSVVIDGTAMETLSPAALRERRRDITMIFQQFNLADAAQLPEEHLLPDGACGREEG